MRSPRLTALLLATLLLAGCAPATVTDDTALEQFSTTAPAQSLRVGGFNMYWLGSNQNRSGPADHHKIADYIATSGVDVLAVSEVGADVNLRSAELDRIIDYLPGDWNYRLFPQQRGRSQCTGVLWRRDRVTLTRVDELTAQRLPDGWVEYSRASNILNRSGNATQIHDRRLFAAHFSAGPGLTDFAVVPLHLKSNVGGPEHNRVRRYFEIKTLLQTIPEQVFSQNEFDVILIGDVNCLITAREQFELDGAVVCGPSYVTNWTWSGEPFFRQLGGDAWNTHLDGIPGNDPPPSRRAPFDRAFIPANQPEFTTATFNLHDGPVLQDEPSFKRDISDHILIWFDILIMEDDDGVSFVPVRIMIDIAPDAIHVSMGSALA